MNHVIMASEGQARALTTRRRAAYDQRRRDAGETRVSLWLTADGAEALNQLLDRWAFSGRDQAVDRAVQLAAALTIQGQLKAFTRLRSVLEGDV